MTVEGWDVGQALNLAHEYLVAKGLPEGKSFEEALVERTHQMYPLVMRVKAEIKARYENGSQPYPKDMQQKLGMDHGGEKGIPTILDFGPVEPDNVAYSGSSNQTP